MSLDLTADGLARFAQTTGEAADQLADLAQLNQEVGDLVIAGATVPRVSGRLARTVRAVPDGPGGAGGFRLVAGGPEAPYAAIVHARNPFLARALDQREQAAIDRYIDHAERAVTTIQGA